jgi:hypothetical protein
MQLYRCNCAFLSLARLYNGRALKDIRMNQEGMVHRLVSARRDPLECRGLVFVREPAGWQVGYARPAPLVDHRRGWDVWAFLGETEPDWTPGTWTDCEAATTVAVAIRAAVLAIVGKHHGGRLEILNEG